MIAALADVLSVVLARAPEKVAPAEAARLGARLRERSAVLLVLGPWPQSEAVLHVNGYEWAGSDRATDISPSRNSSSRLRCGAVPAGPPWILRTAARWICPAIGWEHDAVSA